MILYFISDCMIPLVFVFIIGYGLLTHVAIFDEFVEGAKDGFLTVYRILPTLVGLMIGIGVLRQSGVLEWFATSIAPLAACLRIPAELVPLIVVKMFSSSAATGLLVDLYKEFGTDSSLGILASVLMSCSETIFYTISIYYVTAKVTKTRWTLPGALFATGIGIFVSVLLCG